MHLPVCLSATSVLTSEEEQGICGYIEEVVRCYNVLPSASLLQHIPLTSSDNPLESVLLGIKALTQAKFGSSVFVLRSHLEPTVSMVAHISCHCMWPQLHLGLVQ